MALTQARSHGEGGLEILSLNGEVECALQGRMHYKQTILDLISEKKYHLLRSADRAERQAGPAVGA